MSIYTYNRDDLIKLYREAETIGNLSANLSLSYYAVSRLLKNKDAVPTKNTINKIKPFALGLLKIKRIKRKYRKKSPKYKNNTLNL